MWPNHHRNAEEAAKRCPHVGLRVTGMAMEEVKPVPRVEQDEWNERLADSEAFRGGPRVADNPIRNIEPVVAFPHLRSQHRNIDSAPGEAQREVVEYRFRPPDKREERICKKTNAQRAHDPCVGLHKDQEM